MIQSRDGVPVGDAKIALVDAQASRRISQANSGDGIFRFRDLPPGNYQVGIAIERVKIQPPVRRG